MADKELLVGLDKTTKTTYRYTTGGDRAQTFYFPQVWFTGEAPQNLKITIHIPD